MPNPDATHSGAADGSTPSRRCTECGEPVVEINLLIDGQAITMRSCS